MFLPDLSPLFSVWWIGFIGRERTTLGMGSFYRWAVVGDIKNVIDVWIVGDFMTTQCVP